MLQILLLLDIDPNLTKEQCSRVLIIQYSVLSGILFTPIQVAETLSSTSLVVKVTAVIPQGQEI